MVNYVSNVVNSELLYFNINVLQCYPSLLIFLYQCFVLDVVVCAAKDETSDVCEGLLWRIKHRGYVDS